jgi:hypothetical protein
MTIGTFATLSAPTISFGTVGRGILSHQPILDGDQITVLAEGFAVDCAEQAQATTTATKVRLTNQFIKYRPIHPTPREVR